jgi:7-cyano-7-deazaguanine synthase
MNRESRAVVLLSGGLDSATTLAVARAEDFSIYAMSFSYGQRHSPELKAAADIAGMLGTEDHITVSLDPRLFEGSALTGTGNVPVNSVTIGIPGEIPPTYVPARNTIFLSMALGWAEAIDAGHIFIGVNALDYSGYPDCRPEYISAFQRLADLATKTAVEGYPTKIHTPLLNMTKAEIIRLGLELGVDYSLTVSCYNPDREGRACGRCDACYLRLKGFRENGLKDPAAYCGKCGCE